MKKSTIILLALFIVIALALRLYVAFSSPGINYDAYSVLRQVEHIHDTGAPLFYDPLSFGGRTLFFSPLYHYILAGLSFIFSYEFVLKVFPNLFATLTILVVFFLSLFITKNESISLIPAAFAGIAPVFFSNTINNASIYTAIIPMFFLCVYYFLRTNQDSKQVNKLIICLILMTLLNPAALILAISMLLYLFMIRILGFRESLREAEIVTFFVFFVLWITLITYKVALSAHGIDILWQNLPLELAGKTFIQVNILEILYGIGFIPLLFGLASIYQSLFKSKNKGITMMMSIAIVFFFLLWFKLIPLTEGLSFLGVTLTILAASSINSFYYNMKQTKFRFAPALAIIILMIVAVVTFLPSISVAHSQASITPSKADITAMKWLSNNTPENSTVLALPKEGYALSYFSNRKNVIDQDYVLVKNVNKRFDDVKSVYDERFLTNALEKLNYYSVDYILLSQRAQEETHVYILNFWDKNCITLVYPNNSTDLNSPKIYQVKCILNK